MGFALHRVITHPDEVPGCFGCKIASVNLNVSPEFRAVERSEKVLRRDLDAYKRLRQDGTQPASVRGAADLEARADHFLDVDASGTKNPFVKGMSDGQKNDLIEASKTLSSLPEAG